MKLSILVRFQAPEQSVLLARFFVYWLLLVYNNHMETRRIKFSGKPIILQLRDDVDDSVACEIFKHREYRRAEGAIHEAKAAIVDAGAHAGFFTIYCRALNPNVMIYALEPEAENFGTMLKNFGLNSMINVEPLQFALSDKSGTADLLISDDSHNHSLEKVGMFSGGKSVKVKTLSLSGLAEKFMLKKIDLVKMDIEGGEFDVILKLSDKDFSIVNYFVLEYHNVGAKNHKILEKTLRENHFGVEIFPSKFDKKMGFIFAGNKSLRRK